MNRLSIRGVAFENKSWSFTSPRFEDGLSIIEATNGSGKTTFSDLIYYGLGGTVPQFNPTHKERHQEITSDTLGVVTLNIEVGNEEYVLQRRLTEKAILVIGKNGTVEQLPVSRNTQSSSPTFSDWIIGKLEIPVLEVSVRSTQFKLNITDLMRLMYYDQETPPRKIYRRNDLDNPYVDSADLRKMIFEVLTGKSTQALHQAIAELLELNKEVDRVKGQISLFDSLTSKLGKEYINLPHLKERKSKINAEIERLSKALTETKQRTKSGRDLDPLFSQLGDEIRASQLRIDSASEQELELRRDINANQAVLQDLIEEVTTIKKIILANNTLSIFTPDTCPYCLREVERSKNHCICGGPVKEEEFERFFYSTEEYHKLLGAKAKNLDTLVRRKEELAKRHEQASLERNIAMHALESAKKRLELALRDIELGAETGEIEIITKTIAEKRIELERTSDRIELEEQREVLNGELNSLLAERKTLQAKVKTLDATTGKSMAQFVKEFSEFYSKIVTKSVKNCRTARIDDDYMPELDFGVYLESSAVVPRRLCYFFTLLRMALEDPDVPYPRFMLIDTPDQNGIDDENLIATMAHLDEVTRSHDDSEFQILLTTGKDQYPKKYSDHVVLRLKDEPGGRLLKPKFE